MSILPRSQGSQVTYSTASYNVAYAAGIQAGDLMIIFVSTTNLTGTSTGWTAGPTGVNTNNVRIQSFWKRAAGGESGSVPFSSASGSGVAYMTVLSGVVSSGVPYVNSSAGFGTGTAVSSGACASVGSSDDGRYFRISAASYSVAQVSAITSGATAHTNVTGYSSSVFTATSTGTPARSVVSWAGFFTGTTGSNTSAGTLTLPTSSAWAALSFDLLEQVSTSITNFSDPFSSGYTSYWTTSGNQIADDLVTAGSPGEIGIRPSAAASSEGLWPQPLGAAKSFIGGRLQFRLRGTIRSGHVSTVLAGVSSYNGGAISVTLGDAAGDSDLLIANIGGAEAGRATVNSQTGIWIRITEASGTGTISYSADGQTWNPLGAAATGAFDARSAVPFIQVAANSGADASFIGVKWYLGWVNSAGISRFSTPRTNLCPNPRAQFDAGNMSGSVVPVRDTSWPSNGQSFGCLPATTSNDSYITIGGQDTGGIRSGLKAGSHYVCQATVNVPVALSGTLHARALGISFIYKSPATGASYAEVSSGPGVLTATATGYALVTLQFTVPTDVTEAFVRLYNGADNSSANLVQWIGIILEEADTPGAYFDGDYPTCAWLGAAGASFSICYSHRVNQILNPGGEGVDAYDWGMGGGGGTSGSAAPSLDQACFGNKSLKVNWGTATFLPSLMKATAVRTIPGRRYLFRFSDFAGASQPRMTPIVAGLGFPSPLWYTNQTVNSWRHFVGYFSATGMQHGPGFWPSFQPTGTETTYVDGVSIEELTPLAEGDALSGDGGLGALWVGEPNYSESYYPVNGTGNSTQAGAVQSEQAAVVATNAAATKAIGSAAVSSSNQARASLTGNIANGSAAVKAAATATNVASSSFGVRSVGVPAGTTHATGGTGVATALLTAAAIGTPTVGIANLSAGAAVTAGILLGRSSMIGSASVIANPLSLGALTGAAAISAGTTVSVGISGVGSHTISGALTAISIFAPAASTVGVVNGRGAIAAQALALVVAALTNAVSGQSLAISPNIEANGVSGAALASGLVVSGFHGYADGAVVLSTWANIANVVTGSVLGSSGSLGRNSTIGSITAQGLPEAQGQLPGGSVSGAQSQALGQIIRAAQASSVLMVQSLLSGSELTSGTVLVSDLLQGLARGVGGGLGADTTDGVTQVIGTPTVIPIASGQALLDADLQAINSADGQLTTFGWVRGTHGDYLLWDGSAVHPVELIGLWNGNSIESIELLGLWDGVQLIDQGVIPA